MKYRHKRLSSGKVGTHSAYILTYSTLLMLCYVQVLRTSLYYSVGWLMDSLESGHCLSNVHILQGTP